MTNIYDLVLLSPSRDEVGERRRRRCSSSIQRLISRLREELRRRLEPRLEPRLEERR